MWCIVSLWLLSRFSFFGFQQFDSHVWFSLCLFCLGFTQLLESVYLFPLPNLVSLAISLLFCLILYFPSTMPFDIVLQLSEALFVFYLYSFLFLSLVLVYLSSPFQLSMSPFYSVWSHSNSIMSVLLVFLRGQSSVLARWDWGPERMWASWGEMCDTISLGRVWPPGQVGSDAYSCQGINR